MENKKYDYVVFIGRFSPFHIGHKQVIETALQLGKKVIIVIGSAKKPRDIKNPWTARERAAMIISESFNGDVSRIRIADVRDQTYNDQKWVASVQEVVHNITATGEWTDFPPKIGLIGHEKDQSSYYLKMFPQWELIEHEMNEEVNATDIRELYFEGKNLRYLETLLPANTYYMLAKFREKPEYKTLVKEYEMIKAYKAAWANAPYPPTFVTVDAVVVQSGHVLLVERGAAPGAGLKALPGGFINQDERLEDAVLRELREETRVKVPEPVLRGNIKSMRVFDAPNRSLRGRTITNVYLIELPPGPLPKVKGGDDAAKAMWVPINDINSEEVFEDHYSIIQNMLGRA